MTTDQTILLDLPMPIVTPRLLIRPAMPGDGDATHEAVKETLDRLEPWLSFAREEAESPELTEIRVRQAYAQFILRKKFRMNGFERDSERLVVFTGFRPTNWEVRGFETGYWVRQDAHGKGYAAEATNAVARYAFAVLEASRFEFSHAQGNVFSQTVITKLGFEHECTRRLGSKLPNGSLVDEYRYVLFSPDPLPSLDVSWG